MSDDMQNDKLSAEIPEELHDWYYKEIDGLLAESRRAINSDVYPFQAESKGFLLPLVINVGIAFLAILVLVVAFATLNNQEQNIISNYNYLLTVEGRILSEYRQETEKKLQDLNNQIAAVETRLQGVTDEKNRLLAEMDLQIESARDKLVYELQETLAAERIRLGQQGLTETEIERRIGELEQARTAELETYQRELRAQLEREYEQKQSATQARLEEYEKILAESRNERSRLESELDQTNEKIKNLTSEDLDVTNTSAQNPSLNAGSEATSPGNSQNAQTRDKIIIDQINAMYKNINTAVVSGDFDAALGAIDALDNYISGDELASLSVIKNRSESDRQALETLEMMISLQKAVALDAASAVIKTSDETAAEIPADILQRSEKLARLQSSVHAVESGVKNYYRTNKSSQQEADLVEHLEVKLLVKEILSSEPVASRHLGLAEKLEEYYSVLGDSKLTAGQLIAMQNITNLFEQLEQSDAKLPESWKQIKNEDIRYSLLQIIRELENLLE
jgi:hypothetical protein